MINPSCQHWLVSRIVRNFIWSHCSPIEAKQSGCHPQRGGIGIREGTSWANPARRFLQFQDDGTIIGSSGDTLSTYTTDKWYTVRVRYEFFSSNEVKLSYWIDNSFLDSEVLSAKTSESELTNLVLSVQEGEAWFDSVKVKQLSEE